MKLRSALQLILLCFLSITASSQDVSFAFDDCNVTSTGGTAMGTVLGAPQCVCGVSENALSFDGSNDALVLPSDLLTFMQNDFTIDFYFSTEEANFPIDIFSIRKDCSADSLIAIRYLPQTEEVILEIGKNNGLFLAERGKVNGNCWTRITVTKVDLKYTLYVDNIPAGTLQPGEEIPFAADAQIAFSNSPCLVFSDERLNGRIDEFNLYQRGLTEVELIGNYLLPDQISSGDTTIVIGESVQIEFGPTCADQISWTPTDGVSELDVPNPIIIPTETTTYQVTVEDGNCQVVDEINIFVIDPTEKECDKLLMPSAFTPNDDELNDLFGISNTFIIDDVSYFEVLDRWGGLMYKGSSKEATWDGTYNGSKVQPGNYLYRVGYTCGGDEYNKTGLVTVIR